MPGIDIERQKMVFILKFESELGRQQTNYYTRINGMGCHRNKNKAFGTEWKDRTMVKAPSVEFGQTYMDASDPL